MVLKIKFYKWLAPKWNDFFSWIDIKQLELWYEMTQAIDSSIAINQEPTPEKTEDLWKSTPNTKGNRLKLDVKAATCMGSLPDTARKNTVMKVKKRQLTRKEVLNTSFRGR